MKIILERKNCIGAGTCAALCPEFFEMAGDGKANLKGSKVNKETGNLELEIKDSECAAGAAQGCPALAIKVVE